MSHRFDNFSEDWLELFIDDVDNKGMKVYPGFAVGMAKAILLYKKDLDNDE